MKVQELHWQTENNQKIYAKTWSPNSEPKATIAIVHGLGEHLGRYEHVAKYFVEHNFSVIAYDRTGHGKSDGKRGHNDKFHNYLLEIEDLVNEAHKLHLGKPVFIYGHSMGACLTANYLLKINQELSGAVLSGGPFKLAFAPPAIKLFAGKLLRKIAPSVTMPSELDVNQLSYDQNVIDAYNADPLVHDKISGETAIGMFEASDYALQHASEMKIPLLIMHGNDDGICSIEGSKQIAESTKQNSTLKIWNKMKHEIHNEKAQNEVLQFAVDWMNKQI